MVIGAMAPDFLYFILVTDANHYGHTLPGMFTFSLPAGLAVLWLFHRVLKRPLLALAPDHLARRITPDDLEYSFGPLSRFAWIALSVMIGVLSHVLWDGFTHEQGLFVTVVPELKLYFWPHMPIFAELQMISSVVGGGLLAFAYWRWSRRTPVRNEAPVPQLSFATRNLVYTAFVIGVLVVAIPFGLQNTRHFPPQNYWSVFIVKSVVAGITAGFLEVLTFSLAWHLRQEKVPEFKPGD